MTETIVCAMKSIDRLKCQRQILSGIFPAQISTTVSGNVILLSEISAMNFKAR